MDEEFEKMTGISLDLLIGFGISVGIGFLIGLEREFSKQVKEKEEQFAGLRTFTMISIFGFLTAFLAHKFGNWLMGVSLLGLISLIIVSYFQISKSEGNKGGTSEIAAVITFLLGALVYLQFVLFALLIMIVVLLLLAYKPTLHLFIKKMKQEEVYAIIQFVLISAIILPFLPDRNFGPYDLWNLKDIWKMVVLVSGTSLVGYMVAKLIGNAGTLVAGIVGGLVSSTSVALTFSRRSKGSAASSSFFLAMGIIGACTIMFPRILFEVYVVNASLANQLWLPIGLITLAGLASAFVIYKLHKGKAHAEELELKNPLNFSTALKFALLYAGIQWLVRFCGEEFGSSGTYAVGAISGITDVDAITLSMAKLSKGTENTALAINTIIIAALSNTLVKFIIVLVLGSIDLRKTTLIGFASIFVVGLAYFFFRLLG
jgi:uncharacterized membrane protein (DUF4010 family)